MKNFLAEKKEVFLVAGIFWLLYGGVYYLYGLPEGPFVYALLLTGACFILWFLISYRSWRIHIGELKEATGLAEEGLFPGLPWGRSLAEQIYGQALLSLQKKWESAERDQKRELADARRYYSLWSHQIKTPLAAIRLLSQEEETDRSLLETELLKAEQYVEMALQYQRMSGGTGDLVLKEYELDRMVKQAVKKTAPLFICRRLRLEIGSLPGSVVTDEKWLSFVLEQLLTNAAKYTRQGCICIFMEGEELVIADTGIGILPEDLPRVFEWGYTGLNGRADKHSTGIGLALCRQMTERLGHGIRIESEPGIGTKVFLELKREKFGIE